MEKNTEKTKVDKAFCKKISDAIHSNYSSCSIGPRIIINLDMGLEYIEYVKLDEGALEGAFYHGSLARVTDKTDLSKYQDWEQDIIRSEAKGLRLSKSWKKKFEIEAAPTFKAYKWMLDFVFAIVEPENPRVAERLIDLLSGRGVFSRFQSAVRQNGYQEKWYKYREERQLGYVMEYFDFYGFEVVESGGKPTKSVNYPDGGLV